MGSGVFENEQPVADVNNVYQPVVDDRIAPEHSLIIPAVCSLAKGGILVGYRGRSRRGNRWNKESRLNRMSWIAGVNDLQSSRVPINDREILRECGIVRRVAAPCLGHRIVGRRSAERQVVLVNRVLSRDKGPGWIGYIHQPGPAPPATLVVE